MNHAEIMEKYNDIFGYHDFGDIKMPCLHWYGNKTEGYITKINCIAKTPRSNICGTPIIITTTKEFGTDMQCRHRHKFSLLDYDKK